MVLFAIDQRGESLDRANRQFPLGRRANHAGRGALLVLRVGAEQDFGKAEGLINHPAFHGLGSLGDTEDFIERALVMLVGSLGRLFAGRLLRIGGHEWPSVPASWY